MWVGLYYILSHESTYCKPTPLFCADVRALAHRLIIRTLRYMYTDNPIITGSPKLGVGIYTVMGTYMYVYYQDNHYGI